MTVNDIASAIEQYAPQGLQEDYDNTGLQVGDPAMQVGSVLVCLSVTEDIIVEAVRRECNVIVSHHPLFFRPIKHLTGASTTERIAAAAIRHGIAIYAAHTNLDSAFGGVSYEMAHRLELKSMMPLEPTAPDALTGMGIIGEPARPMPALEFLQQLKSVFEVKALRYSTLSSTLVVRKVALCGGSGASLIKAAIEAKADAYVCGDIKYHDYDSYGPEILLADIGHFEGELCAKNILRRIIKKAWPEATVMLAEDEKNPVGTL